MSELTFLADALEEIKERDLYRQLRPISGVQSRRVQMEGHEVILLSSNNYLGLTDHPALRKAAVEALERYGCGAGASRSISGSMELHHALEERIAGFKGCEAALLFNTGYMANIGLLTTLVDDGDLIISDELNHASIVDGCRLSKASIQIYRHLNMEHLESLLKENQVKRRKLIVTDGIFSMDGDEAPLPEMIQLAKRYDALTMVDEAHAIGVFGPTGRGTLEHFQLSQEVDILMGTFGKALGCFGAYMAGKRSLIEFLINTGRVFLYTTALPPSVCACVLASLDLLDEEPERRERLWTNVHYLREGLNQLGFDTMKSQAHIIPVLIGEPKITMEMDRRLLEDKVFVQGIRPPTVPEGKCRLRVTVMATHTREDIDFALEKFEKVGKELGLIR